MNPSTNKGINLMSNEYVSIDTIIADLANGTITDFDSMPDFIEI